MIFRIVEESIRGVDENTLKISEQKQYRLYRKVPWWLGRWQEVEPKDNYAWAYFINFADAQHRAFECIEDIRKEAAIEKMKKDGLLKSTRKIVDEFETPII